MNKKDLKEFLSKYGNPIKLVKQGLTMLYFNLDGSEFIEDGHALAPIGLLLQDTVGHYKGWYFFDEKQEKHGPFNSFEEAVELFKQYGNEL